MTKLLDVTLRDGGLANSFAFTNAEVDAILTGLAAAGIEYIELGYYCPREFERRTGPGVCRTDFLTQAVARARPARTAVMVHVNEMELSDYRKLESMGVDLVRFTVTPKNVREVETHARAATRARLSFAFNVIRVTEHEHATLRSLLRTAHQLEASIVYLADSNGALYPAQLRALAKLARDETDAPLGLHAHDNLSLAFANALVALECGFEYLDTSLGGLGKGGGNLPTELTASYLNRVEGLSYKDFDLAALCNAAVLRWMPDQRNARFRQNLYGLLNLNMDRIGELGKTAKETGQAPDDLLRELSSEFSESSMREAI